MPSFTMTNSIEKKGLSKQQWSLLE